MKKSIRIGNGFYEGKVPFQRGLKAAQAALRDIGDLPPVLALVNGGEKGEGPELLRGIQSGLGGCPLFGLPAGRPFLREIAPHFARSRRGARVILIASNHMKVKVGVSREGTGSWEEEVSEAFENSYFSSPSPYEGEDLTEDELFQWYLYRQPSLALAVTIASPVEKKAKESMLSDFMRQKFQGRIPFFTYTCSGLRTPSVYAGERVLTQGTILVMIKTDLRYHLRRFHSFEPAGSRLFATRTDGKRIIEFNGKSAYSEYRFSMGGKFPTEESPAPGVFSISPLSYRGRGGRYHLILPEKVGDDGSIELPAEPVEDHPMYTMVPVSSSDAGFKKREGFDKGNSSNGDDGCTLVLENLDLRDSASFIQGDDEEKEHCVVSLRFDRDLRAHLSDGDWDGETSHLALTIPGEHDPVAAAATEHGRLLMEVVRLKTLNQKIFDGIGYGIAVLDKERRVLHHNNTYSEMMGVTNDTAFGSGCPWAANPEGCSYCIVEEAISTRTFTSREVVLRGEGGETKWMRIDCFPL